MDTVGGAYHGGGRAGGGGGGASSVMRRAQVLRAKIRAHKAEAEAATLLRARFAQFNREYPPQHAVDEVLGAQPPASLEVPVLVALLKALARGAGEFELAHAVLAWAVDHPHGPPKDTLGPLFEAALVAAAAAFRSDEALAALKTMEDQGLVPSVKAYNLAIAACSHAGKVAEALAALKRMIACGRRPNSFTFLSLIQGCNFKRRGDYANAMRAYKALMDASNLRPPDVVLDALLDCCEAAMDKASDSGAATKVFLGLQQLGQENHVRIFNSLIRALGRDRLQDKALDVFTHMCNIRVDATTETYNELLHALVLSGETHKVLEVFEWMVEGRGASGPVPGDARTYNTLLEACHRGGMLEKALEVSSWMDAAGVSADTATYDALAHTIDIACVWDDKAVRGAVDALTLLPDQLRPAPYDGMRSTYTEDRAGRLEDELLAQLKLRQRSWAPPSMQVAPGPANDLMDGDMSPADVALRELSMVELYSGAGQMPYRVATINPLLPNPNALLEGSTGYSLRHTWDWSKRSSTGRLDGKSRSRLGSSLR